MRQMCNFLGPRKGSHEPGVCVCVLVPQSHPMLCDPTDHSSLGSSVHGILQARIPGEASKAAAIPRWGRGPGETPGALTQCMSRGPCVMSCVCICGYQEWAVGYHTLGDMCPGWPVSWWEAGKVTVERYRPSRGARPLALHIQRGTPSGLPHL